MTAPAAPAVLDRDGLNALVAALVAQGRTVIGPTVRDGAIVLAELASGDALPYGWGVELDAGRYRLVPREDGAAFAHSAGPQSWKSYLHPSRERLWSADRNPEGDTAYTPHEPEVPSYAFLGVRPCDLRAIAIQDRVLTGGRYADDGYGRRRCKALLIAAECTEPGATCFCVSTGGGPAADPGYDLALTEIVDEHGHRFLVRVGSDDGAEVLDGIPHRAADPVTEEAADATVDAARDRMGRSLPPVDLRALMGASLDAERWDDVAARCLTCGNCTMVCPTCFCTTTEEVTDLTGDHTERWQRWDSCFDLDFSYLHGGPVRSSARGRYRQWLTHKLSTWHDQFGTTGCVGCGRCITWCPAGIDITEEVAALDAELTGHTAPGTETD
ncbi:MULTISPECIES: 4Fe-4S dicluster domain-containing protein [unclassified Streptomyces]|uniref:4Fe-4S dicluster domain-containing protein n=1 Tax=unclassified Streptomyces TaxID=2593676 RepID=UPI0023652E06|nr:MULTISPECIES: 4Fe-4S dicluster domain-containing protein [unclassified Streptomyces]MDF3143001.1 4Fe-4S dicluster domain-containing protein [Streptomyces sp. T21Q-yed]WDF43978.1 4Fe-4S dicluster domain-containing protein [Streptomyces sp. T12]